MKCLYCPRDCMSLSAETHVFRWECQLRRTNFRTQDVVIFSVSWIPLVVRGRMYFIKLYPEITGNAPEFIVYHWTKNELGTPYWEQVIRWDFIPSWTPYTIRDKLERLLIFS